MTNPLWPTFSWKVSIHLFVKAFKNIGLRTSKHMTTKIAFQAQLLLAIHKGETEPASTNNQATSSERYKKRTPNKLSAHTIEIGSMQSSTCSFRHRSRSSPIFASYSSAVSKHDWILFSLLWLYSCSLHPLARYVIVRLTRRWVALY